MHPALTAPVLKAVRSSAAVLASSAYYVASQPAATKHRRVLDAEIRPDALYLTAWDHGAVVMALQGGELRPVTFTTRAWLSDGCRWQGVETLVPVDATHFAYDYRETILECLPDATPALKTPRQGVVTVEPL